MREKEREKDLERVVLSRSLPEAPLSFSLCEVHRTAQLEGWKVGHCLSVSALIAWKLLGAPSRLKEERNTTWRGSQGKDHSACVQASVMPPWVTTTWHFYCIISIIFAGICYISFHLRYRWWNDVSLFCGKHSGWIDRMLSEIFGNQSGRLLHKQLGYNSHLETQGRSHVAGAWDGWA